MIILPETVSESDQHHAGVVGDALTFEIGDPVVVGEEGERAFAGFGRGDREVRFVLAGDFLKRLKFRFVIGEFGELTVRMFRDDVEPLCSALCEHGGGPRYIRVTACGAGDFRIRIARFDCFGEFADDECIDFRSHLVIFRGIGVFHPSAPDIRFVQHFINLNFAAILGRESVKFFSPSGEVFRNHRPGGEPFRAAAHHEEESVFVEFLHIAESGVRGCAVGGPQTQSTDPEILQKRNGFVNVAAARRVVDADSMAQLSGVFRDAEVDSRLFSADVEQQVRRAAQIPRRSDGDRPLCRSLCFDFDFSRVSCHDGFAEEVFHLPADFRVFRFPRGIAAI